MDTTQYLNISLPMEDKNIYTYSIGVTSLAPFEKAAKDPSFTALNGADLINALGALAMKKKVLSSMRIYVNNVLQDDPEGTSAFLFYIKGRLDSEEHYQGGKKNDALDGTPCLTEYRHGVSKISRTMRFKDDLENDGPNGEPAETIYDPSGKITATNHYQNGVFIKAGVVPEFVPEVKPDPRDIIRRAFGQKIELG